MYAVSSASHSVCPSPAVCQADPILWPYLYAVREQDAIARLNRLFHDHIEPVISSVLRRYGQSFPSDMDCSDVRGEIVAGLLVLLKDARTAPHKMTIRNFPAYVRVVARNTCFRMCQKGVPTLSSDLCEATLSTRSDITESFWHRENLRQMWEEILALPPSQRYALLLNLRQGEGEGSLLVQFAASKAVRLSEIRAALGSAWKESDDWNDLPLCDDQIASRLGVSRREVINLRLAARRRLCRRFAVAEEGKKQETGVRYPEPVQETGDKRGGWVLSVAC